MSQERSDTLVLFGATGDLAHKKIFPALYQMVAKGTLAEPVIGVAFDPWELPKLVDRARDGIVTALGGIDDMVFAKLASQLRYVSGDYRDSATFEKLRTALGPAQHPLHYMAVPPTMFET
ncbi:MAG: glucose-6-phosphate dehydrogenase, partial [Mesorhizobium sp.]